MRRILTCCGPREDGSCGGSSAMAKWVVCYKLRWGVDMVDRIGRVIFTQLGRQACTQSDVALLQAARTDHGQSWVARSSGRPVALQ